MPYMLMDLVIDRVDFVDEGANSAAFIEVFKRKERDTQMDVNEILSKLKPEHASVVQQELDNLAKQRDDANDALAIANEELEKMKAAAEEEKPAEEDVEKDVGFDETEVLKSMPEAARELFVKMREQKEAAEELVRKNAEEKAEAEAVAKAATMKSLPIEQPKLVEILKNCNEDVVELLKAASAAIDNAVLEEVGKSKHDTADVGGDAWSKIEAKAEDIAKRDGVTKQKAVTIAIKENPELYKEYLNGGAN
jgi:flagellar biosynthesis GTPase FlhF